MGLIRSVGEFLGLSTKRKLMANLPHMDEAALKQQARLVNFRRGSATMGCLFNSMAICFFPGLLFSTLLSFRQLHICRKEKKMILQALQDHAGRNSKCGYWGKSAEPIGHISGTRRMFFLGVSVKSALLICFLGHIGAEDALHNLLEKLLGHDFHSLPLHELAESIHQVFPDEHVQTTVVELATTYNNLSGEVAQKMHDGIQHLFHLPHAFNEMPVVHALNDIGQLPQDTTMTLLGIDQVDPTNGAVILQGLQPWSGCDDPGQVALQFAVGPSTELSLPAIVADEAAGNLVEGLTRPKGSGASSSYHPHLFKPGLLSIPGEPFAIGPRYAHEYKR